MDAPEIARERTEDTQELPFAGGSNSFRATAGSLRAASGGGRSGWTNAASGPRRLKSPAQLLSSVFRASVHGRCLSSTPDRWLALFR